MSKKKKNKVIYIEDDGHTVYPMDNVVGKKKKKDDDVGLSRKERRAMISAALAHFLPILLLVIGCFCLTGVAMYFWLS